MKNQTIYRHVALALLAGTYLIATGQAHSQASTFAPPVVLASTYLGGPGFNLTSVASASVTSHNPTTGTGR